MNSRIGILPGDFIGPEIMREALKVLGAVEKGFGMSFEKVYLEVGGEAWDRYGEHLPKKTLEEAETCAALLKGPMGGPPEELDNPKWAGLEKATILPLRKHFNLYTNLREVKVLDALAYLSPIKEEIVKGTDVLIVRELTGGVYFGKKEEREVDGERAFVDEMLYKESEIRRIAKRAYEAARMRRKKVTLVAKTNVLKTSLLWKEVVDEVAKEYGDVESDYLHVDNASMQLILSPRQFDVLLTENMFGDILSDEASVLPGSIGLLPSASLGDEGFGMYEPIHGSAPSIADQNIANPTSQILCVAGMLKYTFGMKEAGEAVERAVEELLTEGYRTADLFGKGDDVTKKLGTKEWGDAVVERLARDY